MENVFAFIAALFSYRGAAILYMLMGIVFIISFDKIVKFIVYLVDKIEERSKRNRK